MAKRDFLEIFFFFSPSWPDDTRFKILLGLPPGDREE